MLDQQTYTDTVALIINNLEGGYYHPNMLQDGRVTDQRYASSGETMFGIDRKNAPPVVQATPEWAQFWGLIDGADAKDNWTWNYMGGDLAPQLEQLA